MAPIQRVFVLGGGSAGFLSALTLKTRLPQLQVTVLRSPEIGIIGVGEGTTPTVVTHLHGYLGLDPKAFYEVARPSWKLGIRFLWGPRPSFNYSFGTQLDSQYQALSRPTGFYAWEDFEYGEITSAHMSLDRAFPKQPNGAPLIELTAAYHLENETFVTFLEQQARRQGIEVIDGKVTKVQKGEAGIESLRLESGQELSGDLFVDCSGFRSLLLGQTLNEPFCSFDSTLFCRRAVIGGWDRTDEQLLPYTVAETMDSGWCWQIEHEHRINRGYVFSPDFISDEAAREEFLRKNPRVTDTRFIDFRSGRFERTWIKNVVAIGNASGFVEPLESTALSAICGQAQHLAESLVETRCVPTQSMQKQYNKRTARAWDCIRDFLAIHYRFNTRLDTPFWKACRADVFLGNATELVEYYQENGPSFLWRDTLLDPFDQFRMEGYLVLLVGQKVPFAGAGEISAEERAIWRRIQAANRQKAENSLTTSEALAIVHSDAWQWTPGYYR